MKPIPSLVSFIHALIPRGPGFLLWGVAAAAVLALIIAARYSGLWRERFVPPLLASLTCLMGVLDVVSALSPRLSGRLSVLEAISPLEIRHAGHLVTALAGLALVFLSSALLRRKRAAWTLALAALAASALAHLLKGIDYEEAACALLLALSFALARKSFHARSDRPSLRQGLLVLAGAAALSAVYGFIGFNAFSSRRGESMSAGNAFAATLGTVFAGDSSPYEPRRAFDRYFVFSVQAVAYAGAAVSLFMLLRPVALRRAATAAERSRAAAIVREHGTNVLDGYSLFEDKHYLFSPGGSVTAYVCAGRRAVALRGPIGPASDEGTAAAGFVAHCAEMDWEPVVYQAGENSLATFSAAGLEGRMKIGLEAVVSLESFSLQGKRAQDLRTALNRLEREGHSASVSVPPHPRGLVESLREPSDEWLTARGGYEQRFALGSFDPGYLEGCPLATVSDASGGTTAFANLIPEFGSGGIAVDLMRYGSRALKGSMDALFAATLSWAKAAGYSRFNFGLSALSGVGEHPEDPALERVVARFLPLLDRFYGYGGLHGFKEKFSPEWKPRYLVCAGPAGLPGALAAVARAHVGKGLLPFAVEAAIESRKSSRNAGAGRR
jgi:phosphatidylglycerol lysyltransferase